MHSMPRRTSIMRVTSRARWVELRLPSSLRLIRLMFIIIIWVVLCFVRACRWRADNSGVGSVD